MRFVILLQGVFLIAQARHLVTLAQTTNVVQFVGMGSLLNLKNVTQESNKDVILTVLRIC